MYASTCEGCFVTLTIRLTNHLGVKAGFATPFILVLYLYLWLSVTDTKQSTHHREYDTPLHSMTCILRLYKSEMLMA